MKEIKNQECLALIYMRKSANLPTWGGPQAVFPKISWRLLSAFKASLAAAINALYSRCHEKTHHCFVSNIHPPGRQGLAGS